LSGSQGERAGAALAAGCDVGLHCNGKLDEMADVIASVGLLSADAMRRWSDSKKIINKDNISEFSALTDEFNSLIEAFTSS
jgi:beta-N-acetylhexosaminidase